MCSIDENPLTLSGFSLSRKGRGTGENQRIFESGELIEDSVIRNFLITASDNKSYKVNYGWCF